MVENLVQFQVYVSNSYYFQTTGICKFSVKQTFFYAINDIKNERCVILSIWVGDHGFITILLVKEKPMGGKG